eukprot:scaffold64146_cov35-Tisochrysis_lutea.AAC.3
MARTTASPELTLPKTTCLRSSIRHGEEVRPVVRDVAHGPFIGELLAVDRFATRAVSTCHVTALAHEPWDDAVESGASIMKRHARGAGALLASTQCAEVIHGRWAHSSKEFELDAPRWLAANIDVHEHLRVARSATRLV